MGAGLVLAVAVVIEFVLSFHHMFIVRERSESVILTAPLPLVLFGLLLLRQSKDEQKPN